MSINPEHKARADPQAKVVNFLSDPDSYPDAKTVNRIDTHAAMVFLAGPLAYKIKRQVVYPFLDFSTLEKRRLACVHEIVVNRANAPQIYIGAVPITRAADGSLRFEGTGEVVEWAVKMVRFDETRTLDLVIEAGPLPDRLIDALAHELVRAHARAPLREAAAWIADMRRYVDQNAEAFAQDSDLFPPSRAVELTNASIAAYKHIKPLLEKRGAAGYVRLCHGDAHLSNIVLIDNEPVLFDAIEFDDIIATSDMLYDLAFLLMDLWERGHCYEANRTLNRYLVESRCADHYDGLAALPFFLMMRAAIRAKVTASRRQFCSAEDRDALTIQATAYFSVACDFLGEKSPQLFAVGGLSGTGKSTLAARIAAMIGPAPGAVVLRSDVTRKHLFGVSETDSLPQEAYSAAASRKVYQQIYETAARILVTGHSVIADAVFARESERNAIADIALANGVSFTGLWLEAPAEVLAARVRARRSDASDADETVVKRQLEYDLGEISWRRIDASRSVEDSVGQIEKFVK